MQIKKAASSATRILLLFFGYTEKTNVILGWHIIGEDVKQGRKSPEN